MTETERPEEEPNATTPEDESPQEFAEDVESDPSHNPPDDELEDVRGG